MKKMDEFVSHDEIINRIKDAVCRFNRGNKVFDADIEDLLHISKNHLSTLKRRQSQTFYTSVLQLCARTGLDPMKLLF